MNILSLLCWRTLDELDTLRDIARETLVASLEQLLLVVVGFRDDVEDLLGSVGPEFDRDGKEIAAGELLDLWATFDTWEVDE